MSLLIIARNLMERVSEWRKIAPERLRECWAFLLSLVKCAPICCLVWNASQNANVLGDSYALTFAMLRKKGCVKIEWKYVSLSVCQGFGCALMVFQHPTLGSVSSVQGRLDVRRVTVIGYEHHCLFFFHNLPILV
jgi:hypothetical protein